MSLETFSTDNSEHDFEVNSDWSDGGLPILPYGIYEPLVPIPQQISISACSVLYPMVEWIPVYFTWPETPQLPSTLPDSIESYNPTNRRLVKWSLPPPISPLSPLPGWKTMPYGLEKYWESAFSWFFGPLYASYGHLWTLVPTADAPSRCVDWPWHSVTYSTKVRFQCQCKRCWSSMKGRVIFWFRVRFHHYQLVCEVVFKLFGQQCIFCHDPTSPNEKSFLTPMWYPEEIENAISFLANQVYKCYYGGLGCEFPLMPNERCYKKRPVKNSLVFHDSSRCQACCDGIYCHVSSFESIV